MCLDHRYQRGVGLPLAIFIITVLALIVATMAQLQVGSANALSLQLQSQRAFLAAESGAQVGVARLIAGSSSDCSQVPTTVPGAGDFTAQGLIGCRAALTCSAGTPVAGPSGTLQHFLISSTGTCALGGGSFARRVVEVRVQ